MTPALIHALANAEGITYRAMCARLYRRGLKGRGPRAMYHSDQEILDAFAREGSVDFVAKQLGASFYTVRAVLQHHGVPIPKAQQGRNWKVSRT